MFFRMILYFNMYLNLFLGLLFYIVLKHFLKIISWKNTLTAPTREDYNLNINSVSFNRINFNFRSIRCKTLF